MKLYMKLYNNDLWNKEPQQKTPSFLTEYQLEFNY